MKKNLSIRVVAFYLTITLLIVFMMMSATPKLDGFWQLAQLFGGLAGVYGIMCKTNGLHQKGAWFIIGGLVVAILGSFITAVAYFLLITLTLFIGDDALWKKFDSLAKE
jgi:hypothetical protein